MITNVLLSSLQVMTKEFAYFVSNAIGPTKWYILKFGKWYNAHQGVLYAQDPKEIFCIYLHICFVRMICNLFWWVRKYPYKTDV